MEIQSLANGPDSTSACVFSFLEVNDSAHIRLTLVVVVSLAYCVSSQSQINKLP